MRENKKTWTCAKMTIKFATVKAIVMIALRYGSRPVKDTEIVYLNAKKKGEAIGVHVTYAMTLEALHELMEQKFIGGILSSYGHIWYSSERLV